MHFIFTLCHLFGFYNFVPKNILKTEVNPSNYFFENFSKIHLNYVEKIELEKTKDTFLYSNKSDSILYNNYYENELFRKVRVTHFFSPEKHLISSVWYPQYNFDLPILSIDLVNMGDKKSLVFINLYEVNKNNYSNLFKQFLLRNKEFVENKTVHLLPFNPLLSDAMIYSHIYDDDKLQRLEKLMNDYIEIYLSSFLYYEKGLTNDKSNYIQKKHQYFNMVRKEIDKNFIYKQYLEKKELNSIIDSMFEN